MEVDKPLVDKAFKLIIVDDIPKNIQVAANILQPEGYRIAFAQNGKAALNQIRATDFDLVLLDIMMPELDGFTVCEELKKDPETRNIPIIFLTAKTETEDIVKGFKKGAVDYVTKPFNSAELLARVRTQLELKRYRDNLEELVKERTRELNKTQDITIRCLASLAETRDNETGGHIRRTQRYVKILAENLKEYPGYSNTLNEETIQLLYKSAPLHDIGKVGVPDHILLKVGRLTADEFEVMKRHTQLGMETLLDAEKELGENSFLRLAREIAYTHHEKWDGTGYPQGLKEEDIPVTGRIMALADVYDALVSKRIYKGPYPHSKAVEIIREDRGKQFAPDVVDAFVQSQLEFKEIALKFADYQEEKDMLSQ
ncbi:MAG: response regulator [bacterium]|nr:response regulator [bacterium]